jgi:hypothetical protein
MTVGPVLIFDKSALQGLSVDEAVWLDTFYYSNITPLFFVETLADLERDVAQGRTPEQVVGNLAEKTPTGGRPNVHHITLCLAELGGNAVEMRRVVLIGEGEFVRAEGGVRALRFKEAPEATAFRRWEGGEFADVEREFAREWRRGLSNLDLAEIQVRGRLAIKRHGRPRDFAEVKTLAAGLLEKPGSRYAREGLISILPSPLRRTTLDRWYAIGAPPIRTLAPYTAHVLTVDLFFCLAMGADLISPERPSNKVDVAYLYYLPFCMVFTSNDRLHERTVPVFLNEDQVYVSGVDLKADLARLDAYYSDLPQHVKDRGVMSFAHYPPTEGDFLVSRLWDRLMSPAWREDSQRSRAPSSPDRDRAFIEGMQRIANAPRAIGEDFTINDADVVELEHRVPVFRGKWRVVPSEGER